MPVYTYTTVIREREHFTEQGTVVAKSEDDAKAKLKAMALKNVKLKKLSGWGALVGQFTANVK